MPIRPRALTSSTASGGSAARIDHCQILVPDVRRPPNLHGGGFWLSEYIAPASAQMLGVFLQRKGNPHDIVFFKEAGRGSSRRLHGARDPQHPARLRRRRHARLRRRRRARPGRHGPGHALYVYFRDPDGHRVELFNTHYQAMDIEVAPVRWDPADGKHMTPWACRRRRSGSPGHALCRSRADRACGPVQPDDARTVPGEQR